MKIEKIEIVKKICASGEIICATILLSDRFALCVRNFLIGNTLECAKLTTNISQAKESQFVPTKKRSIVKFAY